MSRLTIDLSDHQHRNLKALAALQGKTIRQYAIERLFPGGDEAETGHSDEAWGQLQDFLNERVSAGLAGAVSSRSVEDIVNEELGSEGHN